MHGNSPKTSPDAASNVYQTMHGSLPRKTPTPDRTALDQNSSLYGKVHCAEDAPYMKYIKKETNIKK